MHNVEFTVLDDQVRDKISEIIHKIYVKQSNKLIRLFKKEQKRKVRIRQTKQNKVKFEDRVLNLSKVEFKYNVLKLLSKWYNIKHNDKKQMTSLAINTEMAIANNTKLKHK